MEMHISQEATGLPLVFLHGGGGTPSSIVFKSSPGTTNPKFLISGTARSFENSLIPQLGGKHPILALDFRGQGRSGLGDAPVGDGAAVAFSVELFAEDVVAVLEKARAEGFPTGPVGLVGFSYGGIVAMQVAMRWLFIPLILMHDIIFH